MKSRIDYDKPCNYSDRVLIGPWVNDRLNAISVDARKFPRVTTYNANFGPKPNTRNDPAIVWNRKLDSEESNFIPQTGRHDFPNYFDNFTSTYDLAHNHFPRCRTGKGRRLRFRFGRYEPEDVYIDSYGNVTNYGLVDYKKEEWACGRRHRTTHYRDTFMPPDKEHYVKNRSATPLYPCLGFSDCEC